MQALQAATGKRLTVVCAPAGYGKTTALLQWIDRCGVDHAWLSLDRRDNDPHVFALRLLAALDHAAPGRLAAAERALRVDASLGDSVVPLALDALGTHSGGRLAIVLDDYHLVSNPSCHQLTLDLIDGAPSDVGVVIASRTEPPLRLAWRRAAGELGELGVRELRFVPGESAQLLSGLLEPGELHLLDERIQGWAAGLALVAEALRARRDRARSPDAMAASKAGVRAYLTDEVLGAARPALREFLRRTSILDELSPSLCEAVLGDPRARALLEELRQLKLFVTALEPDGEWLQYHPLLAETLRDELERSEPELVPRLHRRASEWFEQAGMADPAIEHALAAGDGPRAAALLAGFWPALIAVRRHATVRRTLDRLPDDRGELGPLCEALDLLCMVYEGVDQRLTAERAKALAARRGDDPGVRLVVDDILISPFYGEVGRAVELGRRAWGRYAGVPAVEPQIAVRFGLVLWFAGDYDAVRRLLEPRGRLEQPLAARVWTLAILALTAADQADAELAQRYAGEAMAGVEAVGEQTAAEFSTVPLALGEALRLNGDLEQARHYISVGLDNEARRPGSVGHALALTYDAQLALCGSDRVRASASARRAREIVDHYPDLGTLGTRLARVEVRLKGHDHSPLLGTRPTRSELRVLELLDSNRTSTEIAAELCVSPNTVKSHIQRLYRRLGEHSREGTLAAARDRGLLNGQRRGGPER